MATLHPSKCPKQEDRQKVEPTNVSSTTLASVPPKVEVTGSSPVLRFFLNFVSTTIYSSHRARVQLGRAYLLADSCFENHERFKVSARNPRPPI